jgi:ABC-type glycerol-3-phosphate transport system permease component
MTRRARSTAEGLTAILLLLVVLFPIYWMILASLRPTAETLSFPPLWWPTEIDLSAYRKLFNDPKELRYFLNSCVIAGSTSGLTILLAAPSAYGFSRFRIAGARVILLGLLALQMLPAVALILPFFTIAKWLGLYNTYWILVFADTAFTLPIAVWLLKGFFDSIPTALEEAAMIDGCGRARALWYIVLPLALPGVVGTAVFAFLWTWSEFLFAVVLTSDPSVTPLTIRMAGFFTQYGRDWNGVMALNVLAAIPLVIAFVVVQRWVVSGLTSGAVK